MEICCKGERTMLKRVVALAAAVFAAVPVPAAVPASEFSETICSFDGEIGNQGLPFPWAQNKSENFKPFGKTEIVRGKFRQFQKALRITTAAAAADVFTTISVPVKTGDMLKVEVAFRSPDGKAPIRFGIYGEYQAVQCSPVNRNWDSRYAYFDIKNPKTKSVRFFVQAPKNASVEISNLSYRKLSREEIAVHSPSKNLKLWEDRTRGTNLSIGKKVQFYPAANYPLTAKGGTDEADLTDGQVHRGSGMVHFQSKAVGWHGHFGQISIMVDLGEVKPVKKGVIRLNGGRLKDFAFPKELAVWGSKDGQNYFRGQSLVKLGKREDYLSNFREAYYLPESEDSQGPTWLYPFELQLDADVRYVVFQMQPGTHLLFCDELSVIQADSQAVKNPDFNRIFRQNPRSIFHENIVVRPKMDKMYIAEGKWFPNLLTLDNRKKENGGIFSFTIDMPSAAEHRYADCYPAHIRKFEKSEKKGNRTVYYFKSTLPAGEKLSRLAGNYAIGPMYFMVKESSLVPAEERYAVFRSFCDGKPEKTVKLPLEILKMPEVPPLKHLNISMWISPRFIDTWPEFLPTIRSVGINILPLFPDFRDEVPALDRFVKKTAENQNRFRMFLAPVAMWNKPPDFCCQTGGNVKTACLAYRGPAYREMLDQIAEQVKKYPCGYLTFDVESWEPHTMNNAMKCHRCNALREKMKMSWVQYFSWAQAQYLIPFKEAAVRGAAAAGRKPPKIGFYALAPGSAAFRYSCSEGPVDFLGGFAAMYPEHMDEAQFSYYGRDAFNVHFRARSVHEKMKNPSVCIPWISGGTGAYYSLPFSRRTGHHFLEAVCNGSGGVQYFCFRSFESPLDYYHHALAVRRIAPFEELLMKGSLDSRFSGSNRKLLYTKRDWNGRSLILIGNYETLTAAETTLPLTGKVTNLITGKTQSAKGGFHVKIPADDYVLLLAE